MLTPHKTQLPCHHHPQTQTRPHHSKRVSHTSCHQCIGQHPNRPTTHPPRRGLSPHHHNDKTKEQPTQPPVMPLTRHYRVPIHHRPHLRNPRSSHQGRHMHKRRPPHHAIKATRSISTPPPKVEPKHQRPTVAQNTDRPKGVANSTHPPNARHQVRHPPCSPPTRHKCPATNIPKRRPHPTTRSGPRTPPATNT
jgi:hypothetical protein